MSCKTAPFFAIGMMAIFSSLAATGCLAQRSDEVTSDEVTSDLVASGAKPAIAVGSAVVTCNSGWPGTRGYHFVFSSQTDIIPGTITVSIIGTNGEVGHTVTQTDPRTIDFTASIQEGDAFNPGKNNTTYNVTWLRN